MNIKNYLFTVTLGCVDKIKTKLFFVFQNQSVNFCPLYKMCFDFVQKSYLLSYLDTFEWV